MSDRSSATISVQKVDRNTVYKPGLAKLTGVEMRKMVDTRAGFWLLLIIAAISVIAVTIGIFVGSDDDRILQNFFQVTLIPTGFLLPVLGILMVTSEWSQRTAMATYSLVPNRVSVAVAKFAAALVYALASIVTSLIVAAVGYGVAVALGRTAEADWSLDWKVVGGAALFQVSGLLTGVAFGMLFMNSPLAIVLYFVLPTAFTILAGTIPATADFFTWLDLSSATTPLIDASMTSETWKHFVTAHLFWLVLPTVLGTVRLLRREIK